MEWTHQPGDRYEVTGVDRRGKRFKRSFDNWHWAKGVNVWRGTKWLVRNGRRQVIQRVYN